ncbi:phosphoribosylformylglycinamidine synthase I [Candidatus Poribacteria bacterium]|nr:phosphoribosylformylglycinamidine synthase I [Candidatus Poribacteria bacterium]
MCSNEYRRKKLKPKVLILRTAGTNCDTETAVAFKLAGGQTDLVHIQNLISGKVDLSEYHILALPGGFSYGDDIAAGILLAVEMRYKLSDVLEKFVDANKLIIGICNGFQVLVRTGLLPGLSNSKSVEDTEIPQQTTLAMNTSTKFECRWVNLNTEISQCIFTKDIKPNLYLPVAHAEGRFTAPQNVLEELTDNKQVVFRYSTDSPTSTDTVAYPDNPNGSDNNIAGICDKTGRIFGLMPHPERFLTKWNHPRWTREDLSDEGDGLMIFKNAVDYAKTTFHE